MREVRTPTTLSQFKETMKVILEVEDSNFEKFMGMVDLCQGVNLVCRIEGNSTQEIVDKCVAMAICELQEDNVFKRKGDYTYIMMCSNEGIIDDLGTFENPDEFLEYLRICDLDFLPGRTSLYDAMGNTFGNYPNWTFHDKPSFTESKRRINVVKRFLSAYNRAKMSLLDGISDNH